MSVQVSLVLFEWRMNLIALPMICLTFTVASSLMIVATSVDGARILAPSAINLIESARIDECFIVSRFELVHSFNLVMSILIWLASPAG